MRAYLLIRISCSSIRHLLNISTSSQWQYPVNVSAATPERFQILKSYFFPLTTCFTLCFLFHSAFSLICIFFICWNSDLFFPTAVYHSFAIQSFLLRLLSRFLPYFSMFYNKSCGSLDPSDSFQNLRLLQKLSSLYYK